jgi:signal transduction histidine kinase
MQLSHQDILESLDVGLVVVEGRGAILYCNTAARRWLGEGDTLDAALGGARFLGRFDGWASELARVRESNEPSTLHCAVTPASGHPAVLLNVRCRGVRTPGAPRVDNVVLVLQEGPSTEVFDERIEVSKRLASLGKLAAQVAHELNNPLDGILRYINLALRMVGDAPETKLKAYLSESRVGLMRMVQIIGDLLEFSRTTEGEFDESDINEILEQAIKANAAAADGSRIVTTVDFQRQPMPSTRGSRLYQVCCNLIRNAIDAMPDGGRLSVTSGIVDDHVVIKVADTGVGLPEDAEKIFAPFFTTKGPGKGTGLGLAICKDFVEDMQGTIVAAAGDEGGAVFTVRIPRSSFEPPVARRLKAARNLAAEGRTSVPRRIGTLPSATES